MPSPIVQQTAMASALSAASNILAQLIKAQKSGQAFAIDTTLVLKFVLFTALSTPPNVVWQEFLEDVFPGQKKTRILQKDEKTGKEKVLEVKSAGMDWGNVAKKFLLDQTVGGVVNTVLFIAGMRAMNGAGGAEIQQAVREGLWPLFVAGLAMWPFVSVISFTLVPVDKRVVFGSVAGIFWGIYLSLVASE